MEENNENFLAGGDALVYLAEDQYTKIIFYNIFGGQSI